MDLLSLFFPPAAVYNSLSNISSQMDKFSQISGQVAELQGAINVEANRMANYLKQGNVSAFITSQNRLLTLKSRLQDAINQQKQTQGILDTFGPLQEAFKQADELIPDVPAYVKEVQESLTQKPKLEIPPATLLLGALALYLVIKE